MRAMCPGEAKICRRKRFQKRQIAPRSGKRERESGVSVYIAYLMTQHNSRSSHPPGSSPMHGSKQNITVLAALCLTLLAEGFSQPQLPVPQPVRPPPLSDSCIAEVKVSYHRPAVKGRTVWESLSHTTRSGAQARMRIQS